MHPATPSTTLKQIIKKYGLRHINLHGLRHTSVSLLISEWIQTNVISKRVGHSSISTTKKIYSHVFENASKEASNKMNEILT